MPSIAVRRLAGGSVVRNTMLSVPGAFVIGAGATAS